VPRLGHFSGSESSYEEKKHTPYNNWQGIFHAKMAWNIPLLHLFG
jgi:hypothetical protein